MPGDKQSTIIGPVRTNEGVLAFPHLLKPETTGKYPSNKYITTFLIKDSEVLTPLIDACVQAAKLEWPDLGITGLGQIKLPFRKGSEKPGWEGYIFIKPKSSKPVSIVDARKQPFAGEPKGGDICRLAVSAMPYKQQVDPEVAAALQAQGKLVRTGRDDNGRPMSWRPAVTFLLNGVQWLRAGTPIGGGGAVDGTAAFQEEATPTPAQATGAAADLFN